MQNIKIQLAITVFYLLVFLEAPAQISRVYTTSNSGLSNSQINQIYQDKKGFVWIATEDGLNCFDGMQFTSYVHKEQDTTSLLSNYVQTVHEDDCGHFWIGTASGLQQFDRIMNRFIRFQLRNQDRLLSPYITSIIDYDKDYLLVGTSGYGFVIINKHSVHATLTNIRETYPVSTFIQYIYKDSHQDIWLGTENEGCLLFRHTGDNLENGQYTLVNQWLKGMQISSIIEDTLNGKVLIGCLNKGLYIFDRNSGAFREAASPDARNCLVKSILKDSKGKMWVGTYDRGLVVFNATTETFEPIPRNNDSWHVNSIMEDDQGNVWAGLFQKGIFVIPNYVNQFDYYGFSATSSAQNQSCILSILIDKNNNLWVGTDGSGLFYRQHGQTAYKHFTKENSSLQDNSVTSLYQDAKGNTWIGTMLNGLYLCDASLHIAPFQKQAALSSKKIMSICGDAAGNIWIGTYGGGLNQIKTDGTVKIYQNQPENNATLSNNWINTLLLAHDNSLIIGTFKGLNIIDLPSEQIHYYNTIKGLPENTKIYSLCEDSNHILWVGTNNGLIAFDRAAGKAELYTMDNGLPNNVINGLLEDNDKNLWISTNHGLAKFSLKNRNFTRFYSYDGLQSDEFRRGAFFKSPDGKLFFGGINGVSAFYPNEINHSRKVPDVYITNFYVFNRSINIGEENNKDVELNKSIAYSRQIKLKHNANVFSIEFVALEFAHPQSITYKYKMEGFDVDWKITGAYNRLITYTNLSPGTYLFKVKAYISGVAGSESEAQLKIIILPPWWKTWWAYLLYLILLVAIGIYAFSLLKKRLDRNQKLLEREHNEEIKEAKLRFFTNISHEIRTPITLIMSPLEKMRMEEKDSQRKDILNLMYRNCSRILRLINQIMDMRKIDNKQMKLNFQETEIVFFVKDIMMSFDNLAKSKQIDFQFISEYSQLNVWVDQSNFDKIVFNILSNSFKFTPEKGQITVQLVTGFNATADEPLKNYFEISIHDTGPGIKEEVKERIYDRFFQENNQKENLGSGIGLHLTKQLVALHHGIIFFENNEVGCTFHVRLPLSSAHLSQEELQQNKEVNLYPQPAKLSSADETTFPEFNAGANSVLARKTKKKPNIIIIDDDKDLLSYLNMELSSTYNVKIYDNSKEAWSAITQMLPDVIISDIVMEEMDGIELCKKVKTNPNTNHIPVILLTSMIKDDDVLAGLDSGADLYLTKPFNIDILKRNITQVIGSRQTIKNKYVNPINFDYEHLKINSADKRLISKVIETIKANIEDPDFGVEKLSDIVGMSRVHLNRKLREFVNSSPNDMIRSIRLKQAAFLLVNNEVNISEVAYKVGYSSHSYFTSNFHDFFGMNPSEFVEKYKDDPQNPILKDIIG